ncbi:hypothetical protein [Streptoalloteichus hindustanus]|nr:hypothetical protein [Streptoalloteichus hindustanus]
MLALIGVGVLVGTWLSWWTLAGLKLLAAGLFGLAAPQKLL